MSERLSPLSQRVRRLLGSSALSLDRPYPAHAVPEPVIERPPPAPAPNPRSETGALFEARIAKLSHVLEELRAVDRQRESELRALRDQLSVAHERTRHELTQHLRASLGEIDALLAIGQRLLEPPPAPPPTTLFERMRSRMGHRQLTPEQEAMVNEWVDRLRLVRERLVEMLDM